MAFDENIRPDVQGVLDAAALLDITEYELFRLAYERWHGGGVSEESTLEPHFVAYMFDEVVPVWVRDFSRLVERRQRNGDLNPAELGVEPRRGSRQMVHRGIRYSVGLILALVTLLVLAQFAAKVLDLSEHCTFPPCY